ncbi:MAG TPA: competence/damage-inducible protein A [Polyangiaceae bacterium]
MTAAILCIGTELTRGELLNTNVRWLAQALTELGLEVGAADCTDDDRERIQSTLQRLGAEHEVLVCTGGLGPTTDDITTECVAKVLRVALERHPPSLQAIAERMRRAGREMAASNAKQADFPAGATVLENSQGTAPGFSVQIHRARCFFLPGVPHEMKAMFHRWVAPSLEGVAKEPVQQILIRTFGLPESTINDRLSGIEEQYGVTLGYRAHFPEIEVKVLERVTPEVSAPRASAAADEVEQRLGTEVVFGRGRETLPLFIRRLLEERGWTLAVGESCTGGLVGQLLTQHAGASSFFRGSAVVYTNRAKEQLLGVSPKLLADFGAVSEPVARAMAEGARRAFEADIGLSVTGIAGPSGGSEVKPVGTVHLAVATERGTRVERLFYPGTRSRIRRLAAFTGLALVRKTLTDGLD